MLLDEFYMLLKYFKNYAHTVFNDWMRQNVKAVLSLIDQGDSFVDLGCGDGRLTKQFAKKAKAKTVIGLDSLPSKKSGIKIVKGDLNRKLPFKSNSFDIATSHYSLEHLYNTGLFISETHRILKKGGYTVVATDNLSNWPTIIALIFGYQPFSLTCGISKRSIGNPFAIRSNFGEVVSDRNLDLDWRVSGEWSHNKVLSYKALLEAYEEYGFKIEKVIGVGYLPFKGFLSRFFANLDKRHAYLLIIKARKI